MMTKATQRKVREILIKTITATPTSWATIREAVRQEVQVKNWLDVRAVLQQLVVAEELVRRTSTIRREEYIKEPMQ